MNAQERKYINHELRAQARDEAYKRTYIDIFRHEMRYHTKRSAQHLSLDEEDIKKFTQHFQEIDEGEYPWKLVTLNFSTDHDDPAVRRATDKLFRKHILKKCYVGKWHYVWENGTQRDKHPHIHLLFKSAAKWLARSRIIGEWSKVMGIEQKYVNVKPKPATAVPNILAYMQKQSEVYH